MAKKVASFAIDEELLAQFNEHASKSHLNKSAVIQGLIEDYLKHK